MLAVSLIALLEVAGASGVPSAAEHAGRLYLSQVEAPPPPPPPVVEAPAYPDDPRTLQQLIRDYRRLQSERPGLAFPIAFMAVGTGLAAVDVLFLLTAAVGLSAGFSPLVYVVLGVIAAGFLVPGIVFLPFRLKQRAEIDEQLQQLAVLIRLREAQVPPGYDYPPPPPPPAPPPPPPTTVGPMPEPSLVLAAF